MAPQYEQTLPNGETLITVDVETAREYLARVIAAFEAGSHEEPLIIGDAQKAMAVVLPINQWFDLLDIADQVAADERTAQSVRESLADPRPSVAYDDLLQEIYDPRKPKNGAQDDD